MANKKVWLIGLDGGSFEIFAPLFAAGKMPVLQGLVEQGASGVLESTVVPFTPQAWASVITGNNAGKHGVFGFVRETPGRPPAFLNSRALAGAKVWTPLGRRGLQSLVVNVPMTYPPDPLNGAMVTGMMSPSLASGFTYPPELKDRILADWPNYRLDVGSDIAKGRSLALLDELEEAMATTLEVTLKLAAEGSPDFLFKVFVLPDRIQHAYGQYVHPRSTIYETSVARRQRERIWLSYERLDRAIGRLVEAAPTGTDLIFVSDHGFSVERGGFFTNDFLNGIGDLKFGTAGAPAPGNGGLVRALFRWLNRPALKKYVPNHMLRRAVHMTEEAIDWANTRAYASPLAQQGIFVNLQGREPQGAVGPAQYERVRERIITEIGQLSDPASGESPVRAFRREEKFHGPLLEHIPDIVLDFSTSSLEVKAAVLGGPPVTWTDGGSRGIHHRDGIFIAAGPGVKPGRYEGLTLEDIAPSVLALFGHRGHEAMDGRVRADIFHV